MNYLLIFVIVSLVGMIWYLDTRQKKRVLGKYLNREFISPVEQLSHYFNDDQAMDVAVSLWNDIAQAYGISPLQLRTEDKLEEIISSDYFGDNGLELEIKFERCGINAELEKLSILELITLYVSRAKI